MRVFYEEFKIEKNFYYDSFYDKVILHSSACGENRDHIFSPVQMYRMLINENILKPRKYIFMGYFRRNVHKERLF